MTTIDRFDPFERRITEAIVEIAAERRPDYLDTVFQVTARSRQRPRWAFSERWLNVNRMTLAAAAVAIVLLIGGGAFVLSRFNNPDSGGPPTPGPSPSPTPRAAVVAMPDLVWGDWHASNVSIPASSTPHLVRLSLSWQDGRSGWVQVDDAGAQQIFQFSSIEAPAGEIDIRASSTVGCAVGDVGRYRWNRSADGLFLTLQLIEDACTARATAFARTWVHSLSAVTDGGLGIIPFDPWIKVTVPKQRMGMGGGNDAPELITFGDAQPFRAFVAIKNPGGFKTPCSATDKQPLGITATTLAFEAYVRAIPGASVTASSTFVADVPATRLDVRIDPAVDCAGGDIAAFLPWDLDTDKTWSFSPGEVQTLYILQTALASQDSGSGSNAGETVLVWYQGPAGEEQGVIDSITFMDQLPTP
jgi:hypothetical protein